MATLMIDLPGLFLLFQGEELGLEDGAVDAAAAADRIAARAGEPAAGRDGARTPMPWALTRRLGFTTTDRAWLAFGRRTAGETVDAQTGDPHSPLERHRQLVAADRELGDLAHETLVWLDSGRPVVAYRCGDCLAAGNLGDEPQQCACRQAVGTVSTAASV
jgi:alpha-glucosidase